MAKHNDAHNQDEQAANDALGLAGAAPETTAVETSLEKFKKLVRKGIFLSPDDLVYFNAIPDDKWRKIFEVNFNGNLNYATRVILKDFRGIKKVDMPRVEAEKSKITNLDKAASMLNNAIDAGEPILYITDIDNDGSFSQSIINEFLAADPTAATTTRVEYTQTVNGNASRGFTGDHIEKLVEMYGIDTSMPFTVVTADNGINSRIEQDIVHSKYPQCKLIVTDHHMPEPGMEIVENPKAIVFNPHWKPTSAFFHKFNISGAATIGVLLRRVLEKRLDPAGLKKIEKRLDNITELSRIANLLDYVHTDPMDKPEKDYVVTKFLQLQGLMNVNNSLSRLIVNGIPQTARDELKKQIPDLDMDVLDAEAKNIETQNYTARILLNLFAAHRSNPELKAENFGPILVAELARPENFQGAEREVNPNFIEQLRPANFTLSVDDEKTAFMEKLCEEMVATYESIRGSEKKLAEQMRKGAAMQKTTLPNATIGYADKKILHTFNRKFMGKAYNDENPGFLAIIDSFGGTKAAGSMRSLFDISDIILPQDKVNLEFELGLRISTPGHERAAGFILESADGSNITEEKIHKVNEYINGRIAALRAEQSSANDVHLLTDLSAIKLIDKINQVVRGSISNFERIVPLLQLTPDTIWTDSYTTKQYSMKDLADERQFGYVSINTDFHGGTVIVPIELIRRIVANNYKDYMAINYMDGGVFMAERVVPAGTVPNIRDLRGTNAKTVMVDDAFDKDFKDKNFVTLTRDQIKDNPFFKYNDFGKADFNLFERMVIGIIDSTAVNGKPIDTLAVFDVEANGFGNGMLMNFGAMNYSINPDIAQTAEIEDFQAHLFQNQRGREFLLTPEQKAALVPVKAEDKMDLPLEKRKMLLMKRFSDSGSNLTYDTYYDYPDSARLDTTTPGLGPIAYVNNHAEIDGKIVYNREIQAEMLAFLVKDNDFKVPQVMTNLTGIDQALLEKHGKLTHVVDQEIADYYKGKTVLFGAHNTPYDARIMRANAPLTYKVLSDNAIYDSALFCKEEKLTYDAVQVAYFADEKGEALNGLPKDVVFYDNEHSSFSLTDFLIRHPAPGYYPDRTGQKLLSREANGDYYFVDKIKHEIVKIELPRGPDYDSLTEDEKQARDQGTMLSFKRESDIPNTSIKYSVEKLSEQWMIHSMLLSGEIFEIEHVDFADPENAKYAALIPFKSQLIFYQDNYLFDASVQSNVDHLCSSAFIGSAQQPDREMLLDFTKDFLALNNEIQEKFTDSWMYKAVLNVMEPKTISDLNNQNDSLIGFQTAIPQPVIRRAMDAALKFKQRYGIDHVLQHEGHVNGPWEGDHKGDVAFEDKLTLSLLARRFYNPFSRDLSAAINRFGEAARKAKLAFDLSDSLSDGAAHDSYSYRQGLLYNRQIDTAMIAGIKSKEASLADTSSIQIIKLKLDNDVLRDENYIAAIVRDGVALTREDIARDAKMLDFVVVNEQARNSIDKVLDPKTRAEMELILDANDKVSLKYKEDLSARYRHIEINVRDKQLKALLSTCLAICQGDHPKKLPKPMAVCDLYDQDFDLIEKLMSTQIGMRKPGELDSGDIQSARDLLSSLRQKREPSTLETALLNPNSGFMTYQTTREPNFFRDIEVKRKDPIHALLFKHPQLRMGNTFISEQIAENKTPAPSAQATTPETPKRGRKMGR